MNQMKEILTKQLQRYETIAAATAKRLQDGPEGSLYISTSHNLPQFFLSSSIDGKRTHTYLPKSEQNLIQRLAQKDYDEKLYKLVRKRINQIKFLAADFENDEIDYLFSHMHPERQKLVCPAEETFAQKLRMWQEEVFPSKGFQENMPLILTDRGERVRSKSEKILADYFYRHNIPYHYEKPLSLKSFGTIYPDFTFLSPRTGAEIYWEHLGMMDDPVYSEKAVRKILTYQKSGIFPGEQLILTFESSSTILNTEQIKDMVERYLS